MQEKKEFWNQFRTQIWNQLTSKRSDYTCRIREVAAKKFGGDVPADFLQQTLLMQNLLQTLEAEDGKIKAWVEVVLNCLIKGT